MSNRKTILDLYFLVVRARLIDIAAFMDRIDRADGDSDLRYEAFSNALKALNSNQPNRAKEVCDLYRHSRGRNC